MRNLVHRLTSIRPVAMGLSAGMIVAGVLAIVGGNYAKDVVHDQLSPQKVFFPKSKAEGLPDDLKQYAGQQVVNGDQAHAYAEHFIALHLQEIGGGKTYSQVSAASLAAPKDPKLAETTQTLFRGETLRALLLQAWGWDTVGGIATLAGWILVVLGAVLFAIPLLDLILNRHRDAATA